MATTTAVLAPPKPRRHVAQAGLARTSTSCPALARDGDHHVLPAGLPGVDVVHGLRGQELQRPPGHPAELRRARQLRPDRRRRSSRSRTSSSCGSSCSTCGGRCRNVVVHVIFGVFVAILLNTKGLMFRGIYRAIFILPVVIPPIIVATVWRNMFDARRRRGELPAPGDRRAVRHPGRRAGPEPRLAAPGRRPDPVHPAAARVLRDDHRQHLAGLAAQLGRRDRRPPVASPASCTRPRRWTARTPGRSSGS